MVMYDNAFETTDKISEDNIEPHHTYSISYGDTERAKCPVKRVESRENERAFFPRASEKRGLTFRCSKIPVPRFHTSIPNHNSFRLS